MFLYMISVNSEMITSGVLGFEFGPRSVLNSLLSASITLLHSIICREGTSQYISGRNIIPITILVQFRGSPIVLDDGSNTENRLVITFRFLMVFLMCGFWLCVGF